MVSISVVIKVIFHVLLSQRNGGQNKFLIFHNGKLIDIVELAVPVFGMHVFI